MIPRYAYHYVLNALNRQAAVGLLGPRQVGKTTLAFSLSDELDTVYLDLETRRDRSKLSDPEIYLGQYEDHLVILDEIHRMPEIFQELRGIIDQGRRDGRRTGRFLILGSASIDLLRQSAESLAGRIEYINLNPFNVNEVAGSSRDAVQLWTRGGFPDSFLASSDLDSFAYRWNLIQTYLERDVQQFGFRFPAETLERLWTMLAHSQGQLLNVSRLASALSVSTASVYRYIDLFVDLLLIRRLRPFHTNVKKRLVKSPKTYIRDSGLLHALLNIEDYNQLAGHPISGASWEGHVIENIFGSLPENTQASFYRTAAGAEIDLILEMPGDNRVWALEIKRSRSPRVRKGFHIACKDVKPDRSFVVVFDKGRYWITQNIEVVGLGEFLNILQSGE